MLIVDVFKLSLSKGKNLNYVFLVICFIKINVYQDVEVKVSFF